MYSITSFCLTCSVEAGLSMVHTPGIGTSLRDSPSSWAPSVFHSYSGHGRQKIKYHCLLSFGQCLYTGRYTLLVYITSSNVNSARKLSNSIFPTHHIVW